MSTGTIRVAPVIAPIVKEALRPASWIASIDFIKQLILDNNILISLLGEQGSGKTTFVSVLQALLPSKIKSCSIVVDATFEPAAFLQQLGELLNISDDFSISHFITQKNKQKTHTLLIIDDAHFLSAEFIEEILCALQQQGKDSHFHICLVSNFALVSCLNKLAQDTYMDMIHSLELGTLNESETKTYLLQNMNPLPGTEKIVTDERVKQFFQLTEGHIEKINCQMTDFFSYKPTKESKLAMFRYISTAAGFFLAVSGGVYLWLSQDFHPAPAQLVSVRVPAEVVANDISDVQSEPVLSSEIPAYEVAATRQALEPVYLRRAELAVMDEDDDTPNSDLVVMDKVVVAPKIVHQHEEVAPAPVVATKVTPPAPKVSKPIAKAVIIKPVLEQSRFTIQLLASHSIAELKRFADAHHFNGKTTIRTTQRQGTAWYVLTLGEYSKRQYAKDAANHLPQDIAQFKPWVRLLADLKTAG
jgi:DamX protein